MRGGLKLCVIGLAAFGVGLQTVAAHAGGNSDYYSGRELAAGTGAVVTIERGVRVTRPRPDPYRSYFDRGPEYFQPQYLGSGSNAVINNPDSGAEVVADTGIGGAFLNPRRIARRKIGEHAFLRHPRGDRRFVHIKAHGRRH